VFLLLKGYHVEPVNPGLEGKEILGQTVLGSLSSIDKPVDMVDIFRSSDAVPGIVEEAISITPQELFWAARDGYIADFQNHVSRNGGV
jgi:uncharacterized protein